MPKIELEFTDRTRRTLEHANDIHREVFDAIDVEVIDEDLQLSRLSTDHKGRHG